MLLDFESKRLAVCVISGQLKPIKELNVLILGETGVGKSTWINAIANYISYPSLEEAESQEFLAAIPTSFAWMNDDFEEVLVKTGDDHNEDFQAGNSSTQSPKSYTFDRGDTLVRLIDTPGIGDVRGIAQDKENFKRILDHLSFVDEIHGICILLKPNNARLTATFQFCIKELLTHLHREASKNIVFCFTHAKPTDYKPGDTYLPLKRLLKEFKEVEITLSRHTMYCIDNEAFRSLAALKQGIRYYLETQALSACWHKSCEETNRLLTHIASLKPHNTKDTLSLNETRRMILQLTKPLADISNNIHENIYLVNEEKEKVSQIDVSCNDLSKRLKIPAVELKTEALSSPITVCGSKKCVEIVTGSNNVRSSNYKQICHENCTINWVSLDTMDEYHMRRCRAMTGGFWKAATIINLIPGTTPTCLVCGCEWFHHIHKTTKTTKVNTFIEDSGVQQQLADNANSKETIQSFIAQAQSRIGKLEEEQKLITKGTAVFAAFLQRNAITPYNDVMLQYLDHLVELEKHKIGAGQDPKILKKLKKMILEYTEEVRMLQERFVSSNEFQEEITLERIDDIVKQLYNLPISGPKLQGIMEAVKLGNSNAAQYQEKPLFRRPTWSTFKKYFPKPGMPDMTWVKSLCQKNTKTLGCV